MKKLLLIAVLPVTVWAQQSTYFTDRNGLPAGQAWSYGNQTFLSDPIGRPLGSASNLTPPAPPAAVIPPPMLEPLRIEPIRPIELPQLR